ncbi:hypothetical protein FQN54_006263 [Arachnomyces sp. PD_36]|nr:hypothetical protein FQN54_006263 [Arachnomyces sp. PD_36]
MDLRYWDNWEPPEEIATDWEWRCESSDGSFILNRTWVAFEQSAASCEKCAILCEGLELHLNVQEAGYSKSETYVRVGGVRNSGINASVPLEEVGYSKTIQFYTIQDTPETMQPTACFRKHSHIPSEMDSRLAAQNARAWLKECLTNHPRCSRKGKPLLPKRVVRLASSEHPRVYEPSREHEADYLALSYVWGSGEHFKTTKDNMASHYSSIPWDRIPKTLSDAMRLTLELGVEFIWIDALCIIQDDPDDWEEQAKQMGAIYDNALLTISATAADGIHSGCFPDRQNEVHKLRNRLSSLGDVDIYVRDSCEETHDALFGDHNEESEALQMLMEISPSTRPQLLTRFPVLSRGWIFQERMMSRRMLHCGPEELTWECLSGVHCECSTQELFHRRMQRPIPEMKRIMEDRLEHGHPGSWDRTNHPLREWEELVMDYSGRQFTRDTDRLVALEGVAGKFRKFSLGLYLHGMWGENLAFQLGWAATIDTPNRRRLNVPTWCWTSIYGACFYTCHPFHGSYKALELCQVEKLPTDLSSAGDVSSRSLVVSAGVVDATIRFGEPDPDSDDEDEGLAVFAEIDEELKLDIAVDILQWEQGSARWGDIQAEELLTDGQAIVCMKVSEYTLWEQERGIYTEWLVLQQSSHRGVYRRAGMIPGLRVTDSSTIGAGVLREIEAMNQRAQRRTLRII